MKNKTIILYKNSNFNINGKFNLILSPEFYWVRIFDIPIKNKKDIADAIPTFFEDFLDIDNYKFYNIKLKHDNKYLCFAYDENFIIQKIKDSNLLLNNILDIYFAQNEFLQFPIFNIENICYSYKDDILLKIPKKFIPNEDIKNIDLDSLILSKNKISISKSNKYIDNKSIYTLSIVLIFVSIINFSKIYIIDSNIETILHHQKKIQKQYGMMPTIIQTKSVIANLKKKNKQQIKLRSSIKKEFDSIGKTIKEFSFKNGNFYHD